MTNASVSIGQAATAPSVAKPSAAKPSAARTRLLLEGPTAIGQNLCRPALTLHEVRFSAIQPPHLQRKWSATVTADTSGCAIGSGGFFDIVLMRLSENAPDLEFRQRFA